MSVQDLQLNSSIRTVLVRHWIDQSRLSYHARRGHAHLSGEIRVLGAAEAQEETTITLETLESEFRRLRGLKSVHFEFTNWTRDESGNWTRTAKEAQSRPSRAAAQIQQDEILDL